MKNFKRNLRLLLSHPKDYIYSFHHSNSLKIDAKPYDRKLKEIANELIQEMKDINPELEFYLFGSVGLEIAGKGDLDIFATYSDKTSAKAKANFSELLGKPDKSRKKYCQWNFKYRNLDVELVLTSSASKKFIQQLNIFNSLKTNKELLKKYETLKISISGSTEREYALERMDFFSEILHQNLLH